MKNHVRIMQLFLLMTFSIGIVYAEIPEPDADLTGNGTIDLADYSIFASSWMTALPWYPEGVLSRTIAHWQLDQNAMDSQCTFDGVVIGNPTWFSRNVDPNEVSMGSGAVGMDGRDHIEIEASRFPHLYHSFTIEAWLKTNDTQQSQTIISKGSTAWQLGIEAVTGKAFFTCSGLSINNQLKGSTFLCDGSWHHLAGVYDADLQMLSIYLDGAIDAQAPAAGQIDMNDLDIWIGQNPQTGEDGWCGILDDVSIYSEALTVEQVFNRNTYHVDVQNGKDQPNTPDPEWGKGKLKAFQTIQHAIDVAQDGDIIMVWPGLYRESLFFMGKAITVRSAADAAILEPDPSDGIAVTFMVGEQSGSVLEHFVIINSDVAVYVNQSSPTLRYLTVVNNNYGMASVFNSHPEVKHCIFWNNLYADMSYDTYAPTVTYSCIQRPYAGEGNFSGDPLFVDPNTADPNTMDFHLQSEYGRYVPGGQTERPQPEDWVTDMQTSPCIDAGSELVNPLFESLCNGGRINIGAYGNTLFAGKSPWPIPADMDYNGQVFLNDMLLFMDQWLTTSGQ